MKNLNINGWIIKHDLTNFNYYNETETIFAQANGYLGTRATLEEGYKKEIEGTFINGFYDTEKIVYGESAYGYAKNRQTQLLVPNSKNIRLVIDNEVLDLEESKIENHSRSLNLQTGVLTRNLTWTTKTNKVLEVTYEKIVSMDYENLMIVNIKLNPINFKGSIKILSGIKKDIAIAIDENDPRVSGDLKYSLISKNIYMKDNNLIYEASTENSNLSLLNGVYNKIDNIINKNVKIEKDCIIEEIEVNLEKELDFTKYCFYSFDKNEEYNNEEKIYEFNELKKQNYYYYKELQKSYYKRFWDKSDIIINGDDKIQAAIRFNMFHLVQSVGKNGKTNIAAKGLTGDGYEGHYFWDTETYVIPYFIYTNPEIAKQLLSYRYSILDKAKERAKELSYKGALYPWRTINGEESSAYYPAGTAQIHINADIMYSVKKYYEASEDLDFMIDKGLEMLIETSRFYADYMDYIEGRGYCINGVTGPDEYSALVNNNTYTNMMVKYQVKFLVDFMKNIKEKDENTYNNLVNKFNITDEELNLYKDIYENMYIHRIEDNMIGQDDSFLNKKVWDFNSTPKENYPLLLHYHPMVIYKHQVLKQADLILAMLLTPEYFTEEEKKVNFDYYEKINTHDSSLSECIHSIMANELGYDDMSYKFFTNTVNTDLYDLHNNVKNGVHIAAMAGSWQCIVFGFAGMRQIDGMLSFNPRLNNDLDKIEFKITFKNRVIKISIDKTCEKFELVNGDDIQIMNKGKLINLTNKELAYI